MGLDKFREISGLPSSLNSVELRQSVSAAWMTETIGLMLDNDYIPVIMPNDIDNENVVIDSKDAALETAVVFMRTS